MNKKNYLKEKLFQDLNAEMYQARRKIDYIWEVPEELFLIKKSFFKENSVVVDMGCGPSISIERILSSAILKRCNYIGVDISQNMIRFAKQNIPSGKFIRGDLSTVKIKKNYADIIISLGALHHVTNKTKALNHWIKILKKNGLILMREPTFEALKKGQGESPIEEGIRVGEIKNVIKKEKLKIESFLYFSSPIFHFFNRAMIKLKLGSWQKRKIIWYPVVFFDFLIANTLYNISKVFKGEAFIMIIKKI